MLEDQAKLDLEEAKLEEQATRPKRLAAACKRSDTKRSEKLRVASR
jgi:hypothetical protein